MSRLFVICHVMIAVLVYSSHATISVAQEDDPFGAAPAGSDPFGGAPGIANPFADDEEPSASGKTPMSTPRPKRDDRLRVHLKDGSQLIGKIAGSGELKVKSYVGEIAIPVDKLSGVLFHKDAARSIITLRNGDRLTGELTLKILTLATGFGEVDVETNKILALTDVEPQRGVRVVRRAIVETTPDGGSRIRYVEENQPFYHGGYPGRGGMPGMPGGPGMPGMSGFPGAAPPPPGAPVGAAAGAPLGGADGLGVEGVEAPAPPMGR